MKSSVNTREKLLTIGCETVRRIDGLSIFLPERNLKGSPAVVYIISEDTSRETFQIIKTLLEKEVKIEGNYSAGYILYRGHYPIVKQLYNEYNELQKYIYSKSKIPVVLSAFGGATLGLYGSTTGWDVPKTFIEGIFFGYLLGTAALAVRYKKKMKEVLPKIVEKSSILDRVALYRIYRG